MALTRTQSDFSKGINDVATSTAVTLDASGQVGIGTSAPAVALDVTGDIHATWEAASTKFIGSKFSTTYALGMSMDTDNRTLVIEADAADSLGTITFGTGLNAPERMRIDSSGNVGIGTTSPSSSLEVEATSPQVQINSSTTNATRLVFSNAGTTSARISGSNSGRLTFDTNGTTEAMRIDESGNVGIGTTAPATALHVDVGTSNDAVRLVSTDAQTNILMGDTAGSLRLQNDGGNFAVYSGSASFTGYNETFRVTSSGNVVVANNVGYQGKDTGGTARTLIRKGTTDATEVVTASGEGINFKTGSLTTMAIDPTGRVGIGTSSPSYSLDVSNTTGNHINLERQGVGNFGLQVVSGDALVFNDDGSERMRIDSSGNLLVGTSSASGKCNIGGAISAVAATSGIYYEALYSGVTFVNQEFTAPGAWRVRNSTGGVDLGIGSTAWTAASDETLKENISDIGPVLDTIKDFQCVNYSLKATESEAADKVGFIAQDWEHTFPNVVDKDEDGKLSMRYTETIPVLLKAIQELKAEVEALKNS